jgi:hypothetical protein
LSTTKVLSILNNDYNRWQTASKLSKLSVRLASYA